MYKFLYVLLLLVICANGYGQESRHIKEAEKLAKKGDKHYLNEDYHRASNYYKEALALDSSNVRALYYGGISEFQLYSNATSIYYLTKAFEINPDFSRHYNYWLGRAYHVKLEFDKATEFYQKYIRSLSKNDDRLGEVEKLLLQIGYGREFVNNPSDHYAQTLGAPLNSRYSDHSPMFTQDRRTLIFTSRRTENKNGEEITPKGEVFENIYVSSYLNGSWAKPTFIDERINHKGQHTSNVQLYDNDNKMLVYKSVKDGSIFMSQKKNGRWTKPAKFNKYTDTPRFEANAFVIRDGKVMYMSSGRGSKNGNLDLFVCYLQEDSTWSEPERLPSIINSDADEDSPFLSEDGSTLYFCSRGHDSMGGFDIFKTSYDPSTRKWSKPVNMGYPINTPNDDVFFITDNLNKVNYVTSNRPGTVGKEDIFSIQMFGDVIMKGIIADKRTGASLDSLTIQWVAKRKASHKAVSTTDTNGKYGVQIRSNYTYHVSITNATGDELLADVVTIPLVLTDSTEVVKNFQIDLPYNLSIPVAQSKRIQVQNLNLVKMQYQPSDSLNIRGMVSDMAGSKIAHAQIVLREENNEKPIYTTTTDANGQYSIQFIPGKKADYVVEVNKPGYLLNSIVVLYNDQVGFMGSELELKSTISNAIDANTTVTEIKEGAKQVLGGVYFDFNNTTLREKSSVALDKLYRFLADNSSVTMEISGHTDNVGLPIANKYVSLKRAQAVVNYLINKGISRKRLIAKGYGESQPITSNESSLNGRDVNRRIEIKIESK